MQKTLFPAEHPQTCHGRNRISQARSGSGPGDPQVQHRNKHIVKHDIQNAVTIIMYVLMFASSLYTGYSYGVAPMLSYYYGERSLEERRQEEAASRELEDKREQAMPFTPRIMGSTIMAAIINTKDLENASTAETTPLDKAVNIPLANMLKPINSNAMVHILFPVTARS